MRVQPDRRIVAIVTFVVAAPLFLMLTGGSIERAGVFAQPVSPLAAPPTQGASLGLRSASVEPTLSPDLEPRGYMPAMLHGYPELLSYGPKGVAAADVFVGEDYDAYYTWGISPDRNDPRFVRMVWCVTNYHLYETDEYGLEDGLNWESKIKQTAQADAAGGVVGRVWLVFNEPDNDGGTIAGKDAQCGRYPYWGMPLDNSPYTRVWEDPAEAARRYSKVYGWIKNNDPHAKVFAGGILRIHDPNWGRKWWADFLQELSDNGELDKVDGVHVHAYPVDSTGHGCEANYCIPELAKKLNEWYTTHHVGEGLGDRPIWITETGAGNCDWWDWEMWSLEGWETARNKIMKPMSWWFTGSAKWPYGSIPTNPGYDSMFWFTPWWSSQQRRWWCNFLEDHRDNPVELTPLGVYWYDFNP